MKTEIPSLKGIVFDFDGTLAKLNIDFSRMRQEVLRLIDAYGVPTTTDGLQGMLTLEMIAAGFNLVAQYQPGREGEFITRAHAQIAAIEVEAAQKGELFAWTKDLLLSLQARNVKTGVITRNCIAAVETLFPDIRAYTGGVITREHTSKVKPHPKHLLMMLARIDIAPGCAAMVGDHPMDMKTGKDAGVFTIGVLTGYSSRTALEQAGADIILPAATDIVGLLA